MLPAVPALQNSSIVEISKDSLFMRPKDTWQQVGHALDANLPLKAPGPLLPARSCLLYCVHVA